MCALAIRLFGKSQVQRDGQELQGLNTCKAGELFAYLLLYRERSHAREALVDVLWPRSTAKQPRKCLRQALWELQTTLKSSDIHERNRVLMVDPDDWIRINPRANLWLDVTEFEQIYALVQETPGEVLDAETEKTVRQALKLYRGARLKGLPLGDWLRLKVVHPRPQSCAV